MIVTDEFSHLRVLLVDDEPFVRKVTAGVLGLLNIQAVLEAENGHQAIQLLEKNRVDLLITDIQMPEMNGIELIKQIRGGNTGGDRGLHIIVATSFSNTEVLGSCLLLDVNGFLVKPITVESAAEKIRTALKEKKSLNTKEAYQQVASDLEFLIKRRTEREEGVDASVLRESAMRNAAGSALVALTQLKPGMELLEDLSAHNGVTLLMQGRVIDEGLVNRLGELREVIETTEIWVKLND